MLKVARKKAGLTQQELADRSGVAREAISRYESQITDPTAQTLIKLADALGCSADEVLERVPPTDSILSKAE